MIGSIRMNRTRCGEKVDSSYSEIVSSACDHINLGFFLVQPRCHRYAYVFGILMYD